MNRVGGLREWVDRVLRFLFADGYPWCKFNPEGRKFLSHSYFRPSRTGYFEMSWRLRDRAKGHRVRTVIEGNHTMNRIPGLLSCLVLCLFIACGNDNSPLKPTVVNPSDFITTSSGLKFFDIIVGTGNSPLVGNLVLVHYRAWFEDGTLFEDSREQGNPIIFEVGADEVIDGWDEGIRGMMEGGLRQLVIHPALAYGETGTTGIPPNSTLIFEVNLLGVADPG